jgi:excisionase family DNA binding protein|tara:strand:+ start:173 stop:451 length:279 start_codon:yes stop_codon:yes gene_type:complete
MEEKIFISMSKDELMTLIIDCVNSCLSNQNQKEGKHEDKLFNIQEAAEFLRLTVPTIYSKVSRKEIPFKKVSKRLYFSKLELIEYLNKGGFK